MFPEAEDQPACFGQLGFDFGIALPVASELGKPVSAVAAGFTAVPRAAVPEAPVDENGKTLRAKDKVGSAREGLVASPTRDAGLTEDRGQLNLRVFVAF